MRLQAIRAVTLVVVGTRVPPEEENDVALSQESSQAAASAPQRRAQVMRTSATTTRSDPSRTPATAENRRSGFGEAAAQPAPGGKDAQRIATRARRTARALPTPTRAPSRTQVLLAVAFASAPIARPSRPATRTSTSSASASATGSPMARWSRATTATARRSGFTSPAWKSPQNQRASGTAPTVAAIAKTFCAPNFATNRLRSHLQLTC